VIGFIDPELIVLGGPMTREPGFCDQVKVLTHWMAGDRAASIETGALPDPFLSGCVTLAADEAWHRVLGGLDSQASAAARAALLHPLS
jgi:hypothetical protein